MYEIIDYFNNASIGEFILGLIIMAITIRLILSILF
jgi:hypothetical protein